MINTKETNAIRKKLAHVGMPWKPSVYLDSGDADFNRVVGHIEKGLPYGKMWEISGWESHGKSALSFLIAALGQRDGAHVIWGDIENSFESDWARLRGLLKCPKCRAKSPAIKTCDVCDKSGLDTSKLTLLQPYVGYFDGPRSDPRLISAQELCAEIEEAIKLKRPNTDRIIVVVDSIAALVTEEEQVAGVSGGNMKTNLSQATFLGRLLRRWVGLGQVHNAMIILINQLRTGPKAFGDPTYTPGGNAPRFYSHVRLRVTRVQSSKIIDKGKTIGIKGVIRNMKSKVGGEEGSEVGFKLFYQGKIEFLPAKEVRGEATASKKKGR